MSSSTLPLHYIYQAAGGLTAKDAPIVVMVHGYGSHENDLLSLKEYLSPNVHYLSVRAPISLGFGAFAWYPINFDNLGKKESDTIQAAESRDLLMRFIKEFKSNYKLENNPVWLLGFSQGAILSYALALNYPDQFKKVIALSGYILKEIVPESFPNGAFKELDFFISHGKEDDVIPISAPRQGLPILEQLQISHIYREYSQGHGIGPENLQDLKSWFFKKLEEKNLKKSQD
jgi:phospholipase/carboxylesterase